MKLFQFIFYLVILNSALSCNKNVSDDVIFYTDFHSSKLTKVEKTGDNQYTTYFSPAFEPVNKSPWFAFGISSKIDKEIVVQLNYGKYKHRYVPKLSSDKKTWKIIDAQRIKVDSSTGIATLNLSVSSQKLYVAAQEVESSEDTYSWINELLIKHPEIKKTIAGKTVLDKNNYALEIEDNSNLNSIVLIARQHPPEIPGGTISFKAFYEELLSNSQMASDFRSKFNIYTFPLLNPDGADMGNWRHNANGVDLNRDWVGFTQPETQMVDKYLTRKTKEGKKIQFALDFHTSYSGPYMLILDSLNEIKTNKIIPDWIDRIENNSQFKVEARRRSQQLPYCYNYFYNKFNCEAVTYEEGDEVDRHIIKKRAQAYARELMITFNNK
ncbi:M14 family metallopeptidase [Flavivirga spongiicola]|uniref:M14 family metallopeptidase n=1 Tax=Flavivirga spongiicola TaxID=421621 RepID=A0ABU7XTK1_9FLAO|nr:M14 family metallopeptidase [Flavivirga sp. MEBiC05379]MDO5979091.1 M14 family metallopeptidase [Flavivirga sp. MEBiC05379]